MRIFKKFTIFALIIYLLLLAMLFIFQRKLQYLPDGQIGQSPSGFQEKILTTSDDEKILSWYKKPKKNQKIILYFHGNAGNLSDRSQKFLAFADAGFGIFAISYRGYSGSSGFPSQKALLNDASLAFQYLLNLGYLPKDIILFGESLGTGIAVGLAAKFDFAAVILESPYSSIVNVAKKTYWFVPVSLILKDKFESIKVAGKISSPVLIIHGNLDEVVPINEGKKLFAKINSKKEFIEVDKAGHLEFSPQFLLEKINLFLKK